jgi:hypothetical protein
MSAHRRLQEGHAENADRLGLPGEELEGPAAILERAIELLHDNLTIRQVGDILEIPTNVLRGWLSAGNICIDGYGRLADLQIPTHGQQPPAHTVASFIDERAKKSPLSTLNELAQTGHVRALSWAWVTTGPSHKPNFEATVSAIRMDNNTSVTARASAASKKQARAAAATKFLTRLSKNQDT